VITNAGDDMNEQEKTETEKALEQLTPREAEVLRKRFGLLEQTKKPEPTTLPDSDENGGSGGVPAPAKPPL